MHNVKGIVARTFLAGAAVTGLSRILRRRRDGDGQRSKSAAGHIDQAAGVLSRKPPVPEVQSSVLPKDRLLYIRGWATGDVGGTFGIAIDGGPLVPLERGLERPDVDTSFPGAGPNTGFELFVETATLEDGVHTIVLHYVDSYGMTALDSFTIRVAELRFHASLEALKARTGGHLEIDGIRAGTRDLDRKARALMVRRDEIIIMQGWAINELDRCPAARAYLLVDQSDLWPVRYGMARNDVAEAFDSASLRNCGFRAVIDPSPYPTGEHTLMMILIMNDGLIYSCADSFVLWLED